jgi:NitT/TauT family transport system ATP-binding protein
MARAFAMKPQLLLADEAFGHLDEVTAANLRTEFTNLAQSTGMTTISITHQLEEAFDLGSRVLIFGQPARLIADRRRGAGEDVGVVRREIQRALDLNVGEDVVV